MRKQIINALLEMDTNINTSLPGWILKEEGIIAEICTAALGILFLCLSIKFVIDCIENGYSFKTLKKYLYPMIFLGAFISSPVYSGLIHNIYFPIYDTMMTHIGYSQLGAIQDAMLGFFMDAFDDGDSAIKKIFAFIGLDYMPLKMIFPMLAYVLFILTVYMLFALPTFLSALAITIAPLMLAFSPLFSDMISKTFNMFIGFGIIFPLVFFCIGSFLPVSISAVSELLLTENMLLLTVISLCYSYVMAYSLVAIGYLSGLSFISELRILFPVTWIEYIIFRPISLMIRMKRSKK